MELHVLFMQRKERYEGEFGVEALACIDEHTIDDGGLPWWNEEVEKQKSKHEEVSAGFAIVRINVSNDVIRAMCLELDHEIDGKIE